MATLLPLHEAAQVELERAIGVRADKDKAEYYLTIAAATALVSIAQSLDLLAGPRLNVADRNDDIPLGQA